MNTPFTPARLLESAAVLAGAPAWMDAEQRLRSILCLGDVNGDNDTGYSGHP